MRKERVVAMLLLAFVAVAAFAGGRPEPAAPAGPVEITYWKWGGIDRNIQADQALAEIFPELFDRVSIEWVSAGANDGEVNRALRLALAAGEDIPDAVRMNYTALPEFASAGVLMDLSEYLEPHLDALTQAGIELIQYDGQTVAIPIQAKSKLWFYRRDMFDAAGIDPNAIRTPEDFLEAAERFHATHPDSYIINLGPQPIHYWYFTAFSHWPDARVATADGEYQVTTHPAFSEWLQFTKDLYDSGLTLRIDDFSPDWNQAFIDGRVGSWLGASWGWQYPARQWTETPNPEQWGVALWPEFVRSGAEAGGGIAVIPVGAENPQAAVDYLIAQHLTPEGAVSYFDVIGVLPVVDGALDILADRARNATRPADVSEADWLSNAVNFWGETFIEMNRASFDVFRIFPYDPAASAQLTIFRQHTESLLAGRHPTVQAALAAAQADMESQIGNPYQP